MISTKIIAIGVVAALCVVGAGAALMLLSDDDRGSPKEEKNLLIFGNANNDNEIDNDDVALLKDIAAGESEATILSDANQDGKVDEKDVEMVEEIIALNKKIKDGDDYEKMKVFYRYPYGGTFYTGSVHYPLEKVCSVGTNVHLTVKLVGGVDKIVCRSGGTVDSVVLGDVASKPAISDSVFRIDLEQFSSYSGNLDAVITLDSLSYVDNYAMIESSGIPVIRMSASDGFDSIEGILTIGFLLGKEQRSQAYADLYYEVFGYVEDAVKDLSEDERTTVLSVTMGYYISGTGSDYYGVTQIAGGNNIADWSETTKKLESTQEEWLLNYDAEYIISVRSWGYGSDIASSNWDNYEKYFMHTNAHNDGNYVMINGNMPVLFRIAYIAAVLYPDLVSIDKVNEYHQKCIDDFFDDLSAAGYEVSDIWCIMTQTDNVGVL